MDRQAAIIFEQVNKAYKTQSVLTALDLIVKEGEFLTIIGSSGCGKTTLLKLMNGLLIPDSGRILVEGEDMETTDRIALRRRIGYVIQGIGLFPHMSVLKNITYVPTLSGHKKLQQQKEQAKRLLGLVGLSEDILLRYPSELSGGQRQRVGIARALAADPPILLMDEPFGAVDEITRKKLQELICSIHTETKKTIVFITHDIREAMRLGTRVLVMDSGKIIQDGSPDFIQKNPCNQFVKDLLGKE